MAPEAFPQSLYRKLQEHDRQGNFNAFLTSVAGHMGALRAVMPEILGRTALILSRCGHLISPESRRRFLAALEKSDHRMPRCRPAGRRRPAPVPAPRGSIHFPLFATSGQVRELIVTPRGTARLLPNRLALLDVVGNALFNALERRTGRALLWNPHDYFFAVLDPFGFEDHCVQGGSMGLPLALALYSHVTGVRIPRDLSATGMIMRTGDIEPVEYIEEKLSTLREERHFIRRVLVSEEQVIRSTIDGLRIIRAGNLEDALAEIFPRVVHPVLPACSVDLRNIPEELEDLYEARLFEACIDRATEAIGYLRGGDCRLPDDERIPILFSCYWRRGSSLGQTGDLKLARRDLRQARKLCEERPGYGDFHDYLESLVHTSILLRDRFRYREAEALHEVIKSKMKAAHASNLEKGKNLSALSQLYLAQNRFPEAEKCQRAASKLVPQNERALSLSYLGRIYAKWGKFGKASRALQEAEHLLRALQRTDPEARQRQIIYYHWSKAELLYRQCRSREESCATALAQLDRLAGLYPDICDTPTALVHRYCGLAYLKHGMENEGLGELGKVIHYFSEGRNQLARTLESAVLAERAAYLLRTRRQQEAGKDISRVCELIASHGDTRRFFRKDLRKLNRPPGASPMNGKAADTLARALEEFAGKIPY